MTRTNKLGIVLMLFGIFGLIMQIFIVSDGLILVENTHRELLGFCFMLELVGGGLAVL